MTVSDLASFRPVVGEQFMEPNGWVVVGADANFFADSEPHLVTGTLLGRGTAVRFTPVRWHWDYGDGTTASAASRGATWAAQGQPDFTTTATSHVYRAGGSYTIRLTVDLRAEFRWGGAWMPIDGILSLPSNDLQLTAGSASTVLVERDCTARPAGPGC